MYVLFVLKAYNVYNIIHNYSCLHLHDTADVHGGSKPRSDDSALCNSVSI